MHEPIRDRITELRRVKASDLLANPRNWRKHPAGQASALSAVLHEVGYADALLARETPQGLELIDGHLRQKLTPDQEVPVLVLDVTEDEANKILLTLDPLATLAESDKQNLDLLLRDVTTGDAALQEMLSDLAKDNGLTYGTQEPATAPEPEIDRAAELQKKWGTELGQLWQIGNHRLLCGDSTVPQDVERLMNGQTAVLLATDPPYNVSIDYGENVDDSKLEAEYEAFSRGWFDLWASFSSRQVVTPGCNNLARWCRYFEPYHVAPWTKTNSMTNGKVARWWCWEPVMFFGEKWKRERSNDVFDFPIGEQGGVANHPCPKPLKMWGDLIENYSSAGDRIADAFCGAGTAIVAAEQLGRKCNAMDLEPKWVAVTLERLSQMGLEPKLIEQGVPANA